MANTPASIDRATPRMLAGCGDAEQRRHHRRSVVTSSVVTIDRPTDAKAAAIVLVPDPPRASNKVMRVPVQWLVQNSVRLGLRVRCRC